MEENTLLGENDYDLHSTKGPNDAMSPNRIPRKFIKVKIIHPENISKSPVHPLQSDRIANVPPPPPPPPMIDVEGTPFNRARFVRCTSSTKVIPKVRFQTQTLNESGKVPDEVSNEHQNVNTSRTRPLSFGDGIQSLPFKHNRSPSAKMLKIDTTKIASFDFFNNDQKQTRRQTYNEHDIMQVKPTHESPIARPSSAKFKPRIRSILSGDDIKEAVNNGKGGLIMNHQPMVTVHSPARPLRLQLVKKVAGEQLPPRVMKEGYVPEDDDIDAVLETQGGDIFLQSPGNSPSQSPRLADKSNDRTNIDSNVSSVSKNKSIIKFKLSEAMAKATYFTDERLKQSKFDAENEDEEFKFQQLFDTLEKHL
eukprot:TRINITY_DN6790_c0_g1_i1.p1 TRINITY_DN6790_c0_g1~~TRINITY_DN6790_c0_g1_i1.p1  ORF type:complete len:365 (+),score=63.56 TRINITY_DN6790_c0_g1_i1:117-1211(+)